MIAFGKQYDFEVEQISVQEIDAVSISSTKIRNALMEGNMALANEYLGYEYFLTGTIVRGKQLGRTIDFPTANLQMEENYKLIPRNGVYVVKSTINQKTVFGVMNIGTNPTVNGENLSIDPSVGVQWVIQMKGSGFVDNKNVDEWAGRFGIKVGYTF